jgi:ABC-type multidrug transport system fused ATPase/permease subunit
MIYNKINTLLSVSNINLSFKDKKILSNINFNIKELIANNIKTGQIFSIVGRSGAGKSQLIRLLSGLYINNATITGEILIHHDHKQ